jgi:serine/threonine protein kinase
MSYALRIRPVPGINKMSDYPKNHDSYQVVKKLGEGSFAQVHLAHPKKHVDKKVALKVVKVIDFHIRQNQS